MSKEKEWICVPWHCPNCGNLVQGWKTRDGDFKAECKKCRTAMVRTIKTPRHDVINVYAPQGMVHQACG